MLLWLGAYICNCLAIWLAGWLSGYISMSRRRVPTSFPQWSSHPLWCLLFKKVNHFTMTVLNIRSDPMATWECAKQVQAFPQHFCKHNACAMHFRELKRNLHRSRGCVHLQFADLELFYQIVKMHEFLNMQEGQRRRRPCHWTIYKELCQLILRGRQSLLCWILSQNVEITYPKEKT